ncbi:MAG: ribonuclease D [Deltaproteobacteria bacterium]|nr:ribonuclease D [Deltaproteobacteria bacterium]
MGINWILVDNPQKLEAAKGDILNARHIGIDTEYDSFRYFREILCLIQICTESHAYIFDPLLDMDISFLGDAFINASTVKIIHACDNDIRLLNRDYGFRFRNIFDTYRAASILGITALSLTSIVSECLGVELKKPKKIQRSRWDIRPLTDEQLNYAALDTRYLPDLYSHLKEGLIRNKLEEEAEAIFHRMANVRWSEKTFHPEGSSRIEGYDSLDGLQRCRLKNLYRWRFEAAKRTNAAVFLVLSDRNIMDLSKGNGQTVRSLSESGLISAAKLKTFGPEIIEILGKGDL